MNQPSKEWSLGGTNWKLCKELQSKQNSGCHGNQKKNSNNNNNNETETLKNLFVRNH